MTKWIVIGLIESICNTADLGGWIGDTLRNIKRLAVRYINSAPTLDLVRCGECIHWKRHPHSKEYGVCSKVSYGEFEVVMDADDFCSYGEERVDDSQIDSQDAEKAILQAEWMVLP